MDLFFVKISKDSNILLKTESNVLFYNTNTFFKNVFRILAKLTPSANGTSGLVGCAVHHLLLVQPIHCPGSPCEPVALGTWACLWDYAQLEEGVVVKGGTEEILCTYLAFIPLLFHHLLHTLHHSHSPSLTGHGPPVYPAAGDRGCCIGRYQSKRPVSQ